MNFVTQDAYCASVRAEEQIRSGDLGYTSYIPSSMYSNMRKALEDLRGQVFLYRHKKNTTGVFNKEDFVECAFQYQQLFGVCRGLFGFCRVPQYVTKNVYTQFYRFYEKYKDVKYDESNLVYVRCKACIKKIQETKTKKKRILKKRKREFPKIPI